MSSYIKCHLKTEVYWKLKPWVIDYSSKTQSRDRLHSLAVAVADRETTYLNYGTMLLFCLLLWAGIKEHHLYNCRLRFAAHNDKNVYLSTSSLYNTIRWIYKLFFLCIRRPQNILWLNKQIYLNWLWFLLIDGWSMAQNKHEVTPHCRNTYIYKRTEHHRTLMSIKLYLSKNYNTKPRNSLSFKELQPKTETTV